MVAYRQAQRHAVVWLLTAVVAGAGCTAPEPAVGEMTVTTDPRREQLRDRLRDGLGERYDAPLPAAATDEIRHGSRIYDILCRACHGPTGKGNGRSARMLTLQPPDLSDPGTAAFFSDRAKLQIIATGIADTPMIGWSRVLEEQERIAVLQFMNTLIREPRSP